MRKIDRALEKDRQRGMETERDREARRRQKGRIRHGRGKEDKRLRVKEK